DVADSLEALAKRIALVHRLRGRWRVSEHPVDALGGDGGGAGAIDRDEEQQHVALLPRPALLVEVAPIDPHLVGLEILEVLRVVVDADDVEGPVVAAVLFREDTRLDWHAVADLPAVFLCQHAPDDGPGAS